MGNKSEENELKKMAEGIVSSYQAKISAVATMIEETSKLLDEFRFSRDEMTLAVKENLAKEESLRRKDFDNLIQDIVSRQDERERTVRELLKTFFEEQREISEIVRKNLAEGKEVRIDKFKNMLKDIHLRQRDREKAVSIALIGFREEHKEMVVSLGSLLDKGEKVQIKDFKEMVSDIRARQTNRANEVRTRVNGFREVRKEGHNGGIQEKTAQAYGHAEKNCPG